MFWVWWEEKNSGLDDSAQGDLPLSDPGDFAVEPFAESHGRVEQAQARHGGVEVELVPRRTATEALVYVALDVRGEGATARRGGAMDGTRPANLIPAPLTRGEVDQVKDFSQRDHRTDFSVADARHSADLCSRIGARRWSGSTVLSARNREEEPVMSVGRLETTAFAY
jgi:hypothetical protein